MSFFDNFWALFPLARTPTQNSGALGQIWSYMSEIFFGAYCDVETCCLSWHKLKSYFGYIGTPYCSARWPTWITTPSSRRCLVGKTWLNCQKKWSTTWVQIRVCATSLWFLFLFSIYEIIKPILFLFSIFKIFKKKFSFSSRLMRFRNTDLVLFSIFKILRKFSPSLLNLWDFKKNLFLFSNFNFFRNKYLSPLDLWDVFPVSITIWIRNIYC